MPEDTPAKKAPTTVETKQNATDVYVGCRIRMQRVALGLLADDLASMLGITLDRLINMENGEERVDAPRLLQLSQMLGIPVSWFFNGIGPEGTVEFGGIMPEPEGVSRQAHEQEQLSLLLTYFQKISDRGAQGLVVEMARRLTDAESRKPSKDQSTY